MRSTGRVSADILVVRGLHPSILSCIVLLSFDFNGFRVIYNSSYCCSRGLEGPERMHWQHKAVFGYTGSRGTSRPPSSSLSNLSGSWFWNSLEINTVKANRALNTYLNVAATFWLLQVSYRGLKVYKCIVWTWKSFCSLLHFVYLSFLYKYKYIFIWGCVK